MWMQNKGREMKLRWYVKCDKYGDKLTEPELQYWNKEYLGWFKVEYVEEQI